MNKQELIDKYTAEIAKLRPYCPNRNLISEQLKANLYEGFIADLKQIDEPQVTAEQAWNKIAEAYPESAQSLRNTLDNAVFGKAGEPQQPVVPKFVAEWYEKNKNDLHDKLFCEIATAGNVNEETTKFQHWLFDTPSCMNIVLSMKNGYEIEKQPLYYVPLPYEVWDEEAAELKKEFLYLAYDLTSGETRFFPTKESRRGFSTKLDEITIKSADENYWPFAELVEEVAEG